MRFAREQHQHALSIGGILRLTERFAVEVHQRVGGEDHGILVKLALGEKRLLGGERLARGKDLTRVFHGDPLSERFIGGGGIYGMGQLHPR